MSLPCKNSFRNTTRALISAMLAIWWLLKTHASIDPVGSHCVWTSHQQLWIAMIFTPHTTSLYFTPPTMNSITQHKSQQGIPDHLSKSNCAILRPCSSGSLQFPSKHNLQTSNFRLLAICNTVMTGVTRSSSHLSARPQCVRSYRKFFKVNHSCGKINLARHALWLIDLVKRISAI